MSSSGGYGTTFAAGARERIVDHARQHLHEPPIEATTRMPKIRSPVLRSMAL